MANRDAIANFTIEDPVHGPVPAAVVSPAGGEGPLPVCLFLYGGGGSVDTLTSIAPLLAAAFEQGRLRPMRVACAGVAPFCFYLDDPVRGMRWETLVARTLLAEVEARFATDGRAGLVGISMGGYGALKIAFAHPERFDAVAAIAPMIEPSLRAADTPLRNRFHYPPQVPAALLGDERDAALFEADHPARRAERNASAIRHSRLAVWLDAGSRDACHAHDGAERLHRVLWDLDIVHDYHLLRDADHVGPTVIPRLERAFGFVAEHLGRPEPAPSAEERALRAVLEPARTRAAELDESLARNYGRL